MDKRNYLFSTNVIVVIITCLLFVHCKDISSKENSLERSTESLASSSKSEDNLTASKDSIIVKLENLELIINLKDDEKEDYNVEYKKLIGYDKHEVKNIYEKIDTITINSEYSDFSGISNLVGKKITFRTSSNHQIQVNINYSIGVNYGFDKLSEHLPMKTNEFSREFKEKIVLETSTRNSLQLKNEENFKSQFMSIHFSDIKNDIYKNKKMIYNDLINDKSSIYYKDKYYRKSMEEFLSKKKSDFTTLEDLDASIQVAYIIIEFKGKTKNGQEFTEYLRG